MVFLADQMKMAVVICPQEGAYHADEGVVDLAAFRGETAPLSCRGCGDPLTTTTAPSPNTPRVTEIHRIRYRFDTLGWRGDAHFHLFTVNVADGETSQLTDGDWDDYAGVWSPDGSLVAFISGRLPPSPVLISQPAAQLGVIDCNDIRMFVWSKHESISTGQ